jgi:hypothetical protein
LTANYPDTRQTRDNVKVVDVGPAHSLGPAEFQTGESACSGDSGGPAVASETGAVLGVLSRGGNGSGGQGADNCVDAVNVWSALTPHRDTILAAYQKAGQDPWIEGTPNPRLGKLGGGCSTDDACQSNVCNGSQCSQLCDTSACPDGWDCSDVSGRKVCVQQKKDGGCNASGAPRSSWLCLALTALLFARRKRPIR